MDQTLILVKPDAFARGLTGEIIGRFERKGLKLAALKMMTLDEDIARRHYAEHEGKPFFDGLVDFITSGPLVAMIIEGPNAVPAGRQLIGSTHGVFAAPGTIRGDYATSMQRNLVHGSDSEASAEREIAIYFGDDFVLGDA
jgi:nucleoside-diphosphate kinase